MKTIIWDYNGTILDDLTISLKIENQMLKERNMKCNYTKEEYQNTFCFPVINYYYKLGYTFENETYEDISVEFNDLYDSYFPECKVNKGFEQLIHRSMTLGYSNVILSACEHTKLVKQCQQLGIAKYFDTIMGIDNLLAGSKIQMAVNWLNNHKVNPEECMYIGDTIHDYETAEALNIKNCYLVAQGHQSYEVLKTTQAKVVHTLEEVEI